MSKKPEKTAKDLAFDKERTKLKSTIHKLREENTTLKSDNKALNEIIAELKHEIRFYQEEIEKMTGMSKEQFLKDAKTRELIGSFLNMASELIEGDNL